MTKITGVKSVDFKIKAYGYGVVNWNGATTLMANGKEVTTHSLPKLRKYTNLTGETNDKGYKYKKAVTDDIDFIENPLYISQNCIRHHLFREQAFDLHYATRKNVIDVLTSLTGLIRGYMVTKEGKASYKRTSPLLITDFVDQLGNGNFEQMTRSVPKEKGKDDNGKETSSTAFYSKTTFGDTEYEAYGSISIEQLQFIPLENKFERAAMEINEGEGETIAQKVQTFIQSLDPKRQPKATFHSNYVRAGTIFEEGEAGILLDNTAIDILVQQTLSMIQELSIKQAKGYMYVDTLEVDYNDSNKMMRIHPKRYPDQVNNKPESDYAVYFYAK